MAIHSYFKQKFLYSVSTVYTLFKMQKSDAKVKSLVFHRLPLTEKLEKTLGRPTPDIYISQQSSSTDKTYTRQFSRKIYGNHGWLRGVK